MSRGPRASQPEATDVEEMDTEAKHFFVPFDLIEQESLWPKSRKKNSCVYIVMYYKPLISMHILILMLMLHSYCHS